MAKHSVRKHARFAASSADRWMNCPGSIALSEKAPPPIESVHALEGTAAHECLEYVIKRIGNPNVAEMAKKGGVWDDDMIRHAIVSAEVIMQLRPSPSAEFMTEQRVVYDKAEGMFGTLDYAFVEAWGQLVVVDYKYGRGNLVLPCDGQGKPNPQLMYYASALLKEHGYDFEKITLAIVQPRMNDGAYVHDVTVEQVSEFDTQVEKAVKLAKQKNPPLKAGSHCKYCPAATICPQISHNTMAEADIVFDTESAQVLALPEVRGISPVQLGRMLGAAEVLEIWIKALREYAYVSAQRGEPVSGYKLVPKRAARYWDDGAEKEMEKTFGKCAYSVKKVFLSPAELEKLKGTVGKDFTRKHAKAISSGYNLVSDTDNRPGVELGSVFDFD